MASLHPSHGVRLVLTREQRDPPAYAVEAYGPEGARWSARAALEEGAMVLGAWSAPPAPWLDTFAQRLLATVQRKGDWPRKVTRWRDAP
jgi:hypothetical protein